MFSAWKPLFLAALLGVPFLTAVAQDAGMVEVTNVRFDRVAGDWIVGKIEIRPGKNPAEDAVDDDFLNDVRLTLYACWEVKKRSGEEVFSFYRSSVRMVSLENPNTYSVLFFLPGAVQKRDSLDTDPFAYLVEIEVAGRAIPLREDQFGGEIKTKQAYDSFLSKANSEGARNDGILLPMYLAPGYIVSEARVNARDIPAFYRFEPNN